MINEQKANQGWIKLRRLLVFDKWGLTLSIPPRFRASPPLNSFFWLALKAKVGAIIIIVRVMYDFFRRVPHPHSLAYVARTLFLSSETPLPADGDELNPLVENRRWSVEVMEHWNPVSMTPLPEPD